ncbi:MAG: hypothetical protein OEW82_01970 [Dehalococcoidia bacterium]|nr:hypothetical protein [Dehalococcoidia bacterium]
MPGGVSFEARPGEKINLDEIFAQTQRAQRQNINYELMISPKEASQGTIKLLRRKGKRLEVKIPPGIKTGSVVRLSNARQITDGQPGDILIRIRIS